MRVFTLRCRVQGKTITLRIHRHSLFVPNLMSWFSAARMHVFPGETFCDVGVGSGLHAILAAKLGARRVYGVDINPVALRFARANARLNGVGGVCSFLRGSLVEPLIARRLRVDAMIYNAPQFPGRSVDPALPEGLRRSVDGGPGGGDMNARFLSSAWRALAPHGRIYNPVVGWSQPELTRRAIKEGGYDKRELARVHVPVWGRGNHTRAWLLQRPGRHVFRLRSPAARAATARIYELRIDGRPAVTPRKSNAAEVDFRC